MTGGLLQLQKTGAQDLYLTGNPQISFFKSVYRRYTNFSMDYFKIQPETNLSLNETNTTNFKFIIKRNADLINDIYFCFDIPDIYSSKEDNFRWIKNLGFNIIEKASIYIGGTIIDEQYGEWFDIWNELSNSEEKKKIINEMIGNTPDMYDPPGAPGMNGIYPVSDLTVSYEGNINTGAPSILGRKIRVPLFFWFNRNPALALPLIALQYHPVEINITCRKIFDLYTINNKEFNKIISPSDSIEHTIGRYISREESSIKIKGSIVDGNINLVSFFINPFLDTKYIFLDSKEMKNFALSGHEYLIEQVKRNSFDNTLGNKSLELKSLSHPVSFMVIISKRNDVYKRNDWNNYTNWVTEVPPYSINFSNPYYSEFEINKKTIISNQILQEKSNRDNFNFKKNKNCLSKIGLTLNGIERIQERNTDFFNKIQSLNYFKNFKEGIYPYSFSVDPLKYQPSGSCNMSLINDIVLKIETQNVPIQNNENLFKFDINIYTVNYNILSIKSGMASLKFSN